MFKRYKLKPKVIKPLAVRHKTVGVSKRISDDLQKILSMLKHSSSTIRMRGAREAEGLECVSEEMIKEIMKMCKSDKKEVRALFYRIVAKLLAKALPAELKNWEKYVILYLETMMTCTVIDVRKDSLNLLDISMKYFPEKVNAMKQELMQWLENDEKIISLEVKYTKWVQDIIMRQKVLMALHKIPHTATPFNSRIYLLHSGPFVNGVYKGK
ncbi:uncharacterized protein NEMAJ01_1784 [Nematocida major]|uniref:uncharacterized protein n=1 Tax=Nematocida major TaxID=1912982 RepID=UPI002008E5AB|nr:uncharacterized protein NEMAJ01_1784 [Nematocida major]KAH9386888.1 hypothetical protein NEMAJ01_1784 [Nematocida major]